MNIERRIKQIEAKMMKRDYPSPNSYWVIENYTIDRDGDDKFITINIRCGWYNPEDKNDARNFQKHYNIWCCLEDFNYSYIRGYIEGYGFAREELGEDE